MSLPKVEGTRRSRRRVSTVDSPDEPGFVGQTDRNPSFSPREVQDSLPFFDPPGSRRESGVVRRGTSCSVPGSLTRLGRRTPKTGRGLKRGPDDPSVLFRRSRRTPVVRTPGALYRSGVLGGP